MRLESCAVLLETLGDQGDKLLLCKALGAGWSAKLEELVPNAKESSSSKAIAVRFLATTTLVDDPLDFPDDFLDFDNFDWHFDNLLDCNNLLCDHWYFLDPLNFDKLVFINNLFNNNFDFLKFY